MEKKTLSDMVILVIDDDQDVRLLLEKFLSIEGCKVLLAASGKEGLDIFNQEICDVVLLDISLGDADGIDIAKIMRKKKGELFSIIGITAYPRDMLEKKYSKALTLFTDFCFKPFSHEDLISLLKTT